MLKLIKKYQSGGSLIDTASMRDDVKTDSSFFKNGRYTVKGKKRLAAIQEIEDNQDLGLKYEVNAARTTFNIVDAGGNKVEAEGGRGKGVDEKSFLYGAFSAKNRAKKEVSKAMYGADKYLIKKKEQLSPKKEEERLEKRRVEKEVEKTASGGSTKSKDEVTKPEYMGRGKSRSSDIGMDLFYAPDASTKLNLGTRQNPTINRSKTETSGTGTGADASTVTEEESEAPFKAETSSALAPEPGSALDNMLTDMQHNIYKIQTGIVDSKKDRFSSQYEDYSFPMMQDKIDKINEEIKVASTVESPDLDKIKKMEEEVASLKGSMTDALKEQGQYTSNSVLDYINIKQAELEQSGFGGDKDLKKKALDQIKLLKEDWLTTYTSFAENPTLENLNKLYPSGTPGDGTETRSANPVDYFTKDPLQRTKEALLSDKLSKNPEIVGNLTMDNAQEVIDQLGVRDELKALLPYYDKDKDVSEIFMNIANPTANPGTHYWKKSTATEKGRFYKPGEYEDLQLEKNTSDYKKAKASEQLTNNQSYAVNAERLKVLNGEIRALQADLSKNPENITKKNAVTSKQKEIDALLAKQANAESGWMGMKLNQLPTQEAFNYRIQKMKEAADTYQTYQSGLTDYSKKVTKEIPAGFDRSSLSDKAQMGIWSAADQIGGALGLSVNKDRQAASIPEARTEIGYAKRKPLSEAELIKRGMPRNDAEYKKLRSQIESLQRLKSRGAWQLQRFLKENPGVEELFGGTPNLEFLLKSPNMKGNSYNAKGKRWALQNITPYKHGGKLISKHQKGGAIPKFQFGGGTDNWLTTSLDGRSYTDLLADQQKKIELQKKKNDAARSRLAPSTDSYLGLTPFLNYDPLRKPFQPVADLPEGDYEAGELDESGYNQMSSSERDSPEIKALLAKQAKEQFNQELINNAKKPQGGGMEIIDPTTGLPLVKDGTGGTGSGDNNVLGLGRTGLNIGGHEVQYNTIGQFLLALRAKNKKVDEVPMWEEKAVQTGARNVLAARDMDTGMLNQAKKQISKIQSGYKGSDPVMNMISKNIAGEARQKANLNLTAQRSAYRRGEEDRVDTQMEQRRQQLAQDNARKTEVDNRIKQRKYQGDLQAAQNKQIKESQFYQNLSTLMKDQQEQNNQRALMEKQFKTNLSVQEQQNKQSTANTEYKSANEAYQLALYRGDEAAITAAAQRLKDAKTALNETATFDKDALMEEYRNNDVLSLIKRKKFD